MDCKITSTKRARRRQAGLTLVESSVGMTLALLLMVAVVSFTMYTGRSFAGLANYVDLEASSQKALDTMTRDIRQTQAMLSIAPNQLIFNDWDSQPLTYTYSPTARTLTKTKGNVTQVLLNECDFLSFSNYQRTPMEGKYEQYPVSTSPTNTKLVSVTWVCSRQITGTKLNTESVQTAKIVIRKQ
jgi:hypothetical protein